MDEPTRNFLRQDLGFKEGNFDKLDPLDVMIPDLSGVV